MSILGSGSSHMQGNRRIRAPAASAAAANARCQKCHQQGHWTYQCTGEAVYRARPTRTQQLLNPKLRPKFLEPTEVLPEDQDIKVQKAAAPRKRRRQDSDSSDSSSDSDSSSSSSSSDSDSSSSSSSGSGSSSDSDSDSSSDSSGSSSSSSSSSGSGSDSDTDSDSASDSKAAEHTKQPARNARHRESVRDTKTSRERDDQRCVPQHLRDRLGSRQPSAAARYDDRYGDTRAHNRHEDAQYGGSDHRHSRHDRLAGEDRYDRRAAGSGHESARETRHAAEVQKPRVASRVERVPRRADDGINDRWTGQYESDTDRHRSNRHTAHPSDSHKRRASTSGSSGSDSDTSSSQS